MVGSVSGVKVLQQWVLEQQCLQPWQAVWLHLMSSNLFSPHSRYAIGTFLASNTFCQWIHTFKCILALKLNGPPFASKLQCCTYIKILDQRTGQVYFTLCILFRINYGPLWWSIVFVSSVQCGYVQHSFCEEIAGTRESQGYMWYEHCQDNHPTKWLFSKNGFSTVSFRSTKS